MRNPSLHAVLAEFTADAAFGLAAEAERGAEMPFELVAEPGGSAPLYCYRPLTGRYIDERQRLLRALASYAPVVRALAELEMTEAYLRQQGESHVPSDARASAELALRCFLERVFADRSTFTFDPERFEAAYRELELALYEGQRTTTVLTPLLGLALDHDSRELAIGDGLALVRGDLVSDAPREAVWGEGHPGVLLVLRLTEEPAGGPAISLARKRFRRLLTSLRLFERGGYALGPLAWMRSDGGTWRPLALGSTGRPRSLTFLSAGQEDELRAFHNLIARRTPAAGEVAWALARFEMGCERLTPFEGLSDYLLALRALLEPEGPSSGRLPGRLAALCAQAEEHAALAERAARAIELERTVMGGAAPPQPGADALVAELAEHLRAILRDVLCGHLPGELGALADELLAEAATAS